jgi:hypothetical protein
VSAGELAGTRALPRPKAMSAAAACCRPCSGPLMSSLARALGAPPRVDAPQLFSPPKRPVPSRNHDQAPTLVADRRYGHAMNLWYSWSWWGSPRTGTTVTLRRGVGAERKEAGVEGRPETSEGFAVDRVQLGYPMTHSIKH